MTDRDEETLVGLRIRELRKGKGLSLRALAELSGLSPNAISLIERSENSPTVSSLRQLAKALEVPITAFFQGPSEETVAFIKLDQRSRSYAEGVAIESLGKGLTDQHLEPFLVTVEPGAGTDSESYSHAGEEFVQCLEGMIEYRVDDRLYQMEPGDSLLFKADQMHSFSNRSGAQAVALIITGEKQQEGRADLAAHRTLHQ